MYNISLKNKAKALRIKGSTVRDIAKKLKVSFSTVSFWCRNIKLSKNTIEKMSFNKKAKSIKGLLKYSEKKRTQRINNTIFQKKIGANTVGRLSKRDLFMTGLGLYWGEGYKESNDELGFTNSNPEMILFYMKWLTIQNVLKQDLIFRLSLNEVFRKDADKIKRFWIKYLTIKNGQFTKTTFIKTNLKKAFVRRGNQYRGILRVKVRRGLTLKNNILGAIDHIARS